jgi:iron complex transport system substrate-binding protein
MSVRYLAVLAGFVAALLSASSGVVAAPTSERAVTPIVAPAPTRIVSTSPSITETLFALGLGDRVVGVSRFCRYPERARQLPKIGTLLKPDVELIARLTPDLVIVHAGPHDTPRQLAVLRIPFLVVDRGTLPAVFATIRAIGRAAGASDRADALVATLEGRLARIRAAVAGRPVRTVLMIVGRRPGMLADLVAVGRDSYLNDIVTLAGGRNVLAQDGLPDYPRISMETVVRLAPQVVLDAGDMGDTADDRERRRQMTEGLWAAQRLASAEAHALASDAFVVPGPRVVDAAEAVAGWLHGVTFHR